MAPYFWNWQICQWAMGHSVFGIRHNFNLTNDLIVLGIWLLIVLYYKKKVSIRDLKSLESRILNFQKKIMLPAWGSLLTQGLHWIKWEKSCFLKFNPAWNQKNIFKIVLGVQCSTVGRNVSNVIMIRWVIKFFFRESLMIRSWFQDSFDFKSKNSGSAAPAWWPGGLVGNPND